MPCSSQNSSLKMNTGFFLGSDAIIACLSLIIYGNSETRAVSFDPVLCLLNGSLFEIFFCEYFQQHPHVYQYLKNT